jgi:hypothetical protein
MFSRQDGPVGDKPGEMGVGVQLILGLFLLLGFSALAWWLLAGG